jgi:hypothetical protein
MDPAKAKSAYQTILGNLSHPYHDSKHPNHHAAVQEVQKLFADAYPTIKEK